MATRLGVWRDLWFGEVSLGKRGDKVRFNSAKSPLMTGVVMRVGQRYLVDWDDDSVDAEAWLNFADGAKDAALTLAKVDPQADFSFDYEDLAFTRERDCD